SEDAQSQAVYEAAEALAAGGEVAGIQLFVGGASAAARWGQLDSVTRGPDGADLLGAADGFSQAQTEINEALVHHALRLAHPLAGARVLELYAGHGNLTAALASQAAQVVAVEADAKAAEACRRNMTARGHQHVKVVVGPAE